MTWETFYKVIASNLQNIKVITLRNAWGTNPGGIILEKKATMHLAILSWEPLL